MISTTISWEDFEKIDLRVGTIVDARVFPEAKTPSLKLSVDLGHLGIRRSSAHITELYAPESLVGRQVVCVVNFPRKQIANFISEVLVTGFEDHERRVVLCGVDKPVPNGARLF